VLKEIIASRAVAGLARGVLSAVSKMAAGDYEKAQA